PRTNVSGPTEPVCRPAGSSPPICKNLPKPIGEVLPVHLPPSPPLLRPQQPTDKGGSRRGQLGIAGLTSLKCREVRGLGEDQQLIECIYTQSRDQIQTRA